MCGAVDADVDVGALFASIDTDVQDVCVTDLT